MKDKGLVYIVSYWTEGDVELEEVIDSAYDTLDAAKLREDEIETTLTNINEVMLRGE